MQDTSETKEFWAQHAATRCDTLRHAATNPGGVALRLRLTALEADRLSALQFRAQSGKAKGRGKSAWRLAGPETDATGVKVRHGGFGSDF